MNKNTKKIDMVFDENYMKIRESLTGLKEILDICFFERNIYKQMGMDNLKALHDNLIELLKHTYSPREVRIKMRELEYDGLEAPSSFLSP
jgi:hypothetical protein